MIVFFLGMLVLHVPLQSYDLKLQGVRNGNVMSDCFEMEDMHNHVELPSNGKMLGKKWTFFPMLCLY